MSSSRHSSAALLPPTVERLGGGFAAFVHLDGSWGCLS